MSDLDKAVELARRCLDDDMCDPACHACILARAVLAMAPAVEAARKQAAARANARWQAEPSTVPGLDDACEATESAIRTLDAEARRG